MDGLRGTRAIVVANVLVDDAADVIGGQEDEVMQRLCPQRPHEAFDVRQALGAP